MMMPDQNGGIKLSRKEVRLLIVESFTILLMASRRDKSERKVGERHQNSTLGSGKVWPIINKRSIYLSSSFPIRGSFFQCVVSQRNNPFFLILPEVVRRKLVIFCGETMLSVNSGGRNAPPIKQFGFL